MSFISKAGNVVPTTINSATTETSPKVPSRGIVGLTDAQIGRKPAVKLGETHVDPMTVKESAPSKSTYHSTLFEAFNLNAVATYNFYTRDETVSFVADVSASLADLPRYVTLTWRPAPSRSIVLQGNKAFKSFMGNAPRYHGVVPLDVAHAAASNGHVNPGAMSALIKPPPPPNAGPQLDIDTFLLSPDSAGDLAASHVGRPESQFTTPPPVGTDAFRVVFVDPSVAGALHPNRLAVSTDGLHLNVAGSLAKIIGGLEVISEFNQDMLPNGQPPSFPAPVDSPVLTYHGYVIERYDLAENGLMKLGRTIRIDNVETGYYVDREVLFGKTYAYKIRVIVQWVRPSNYGFDGRSQVDRTNGISEAIGTKLASYYFGDWSDWSRTSVVDTIPPDPPDELTVMPLSRKGKIRVCWKMPNDPQRDIDSLHLLRAVVQGGEVSDWTEVGRFVPSNGAYDDLDVKSYEETGREYIYSMYSTSAHGETSMLGEQVKARIVGPRVPHEHPLARVAGPGADPTVHPSGGDSRESTEVIARRRVILYCRGGQSVHPLRDKDYLLDVRSLATGERVRVSLNVDSTEILPKDA